MKRIYLLLAIIALLSTGNTTKAQSTDLELKHVTISDTMFYGGTIAHIIRWRFINKGPTALVQATDTILLARAYRVNNQNRVRLILPTAGLPVGDSVSFADTVQWSNAPATNPYTWCDTATVYRSGIAMTDPTPANNQKCKTIPFVQQPASINDFVAENSLVVYPNPATSNLNVSYNLVNSAKSVTVTIRNLVGQAVYTEEVKDNTRGGKQVSINLNNIPSGLYTAELNVDGAKITNKFSVAK